MDDRQLAIMPTQIIEKKPLIPSADDGKLKETPPVSMPRSGIPLDQLMNSVKQHVQSVHHLKKAHRDACKQHRETAGRSVGGWIFFVLDLPLTIVLYLTALPPNKENYCRIQALVWCILGPGNYFAIKKISRVHPYGIPIWDRHSAMALCLIANIHSVANNILVEPWKSFPRIKVGILFHHNSSIGWPQPHENYSKRVDQYAGPCWGAFQPPEDLSGSHYSRRWKCTARCIHNHGSGKEWQSNPGY
jgi:hypothetical protein